MWLDLNVTLNYEKRKTMSYKGKDCDGLCVHEWEIKQYFVVILAVLDVWLKAQKPFKCQLHIHGA